MPHTTRVLIINARGQEFFASRNAAQALEDSNKGHWVDDAKTVFKLYERDHATEGQQFEWHGRVSGRTKLEREMGIDLGMRVKQAERTLVHR